jgi:hypothetical protein
MSQKWLICVVLIDGLLSICSDADRLRIQPDYMISLETVYTRLAVRMLHEYKNLEFLSSKSFGAGPHTNPSLPTWVPNWRIAEHQDSIHRKEYLASASTPLNARISPASELIIDGVEVDWISKPIYTFCRTLSTLLWASDPECQKQSVEFIAAIEKLRHDMNSRDINIEGIMSHTLVASAWHPGEELDPECSPEEAFRSITSFMTRSTNIDTDESSSVLGSTKNQDRLVRLFGEHSLVENRALCLTKKNRLCLGPRGAQAGDAVVVLFGGKTLYILRQLEDNFQYIGDAFIHGLVSLGTRLSHNRTANFSVDEWRVCAWKEP